jgi:predicted transcriptional regulator
MATYHDIVNAVRELMGRNLDVYEIASRLKIDIVTVQSIIDLLT